MIRGKTMRWTKLLIAFGTADGSEQTLPASSLGTDGSASRLCFAGHRRAVFGKVGLHCHVSILAR